MFTLTGNLEVYYIDLDFIRSLFMQNLNLATLRAANIARLPRFRNNKGEPAHSKVDGSDWSPSMWLVALMGEVAETAVEITSPDADVNKKRRVASELADVQIYLDILAQRCLDFPTHPQDAQKPTFEDGLVQIIIAVGGMCEAYKKSIRGDIEPLKRDGLMVRHLNELRKLSEDIAYMDYGNTWDGLPNEGVDLAEATMTKFNATTRRVGAEVYLNADYIVVEGTSYDPDEVNADSYKKFARPD